MKRQILEQMAAKGGAIQLAGEAIERATKALPTDATVEMSVEETEAFIQQLARMMFIVDATMVGLRAEIGTMRMLANRSAKS